MQIVIDYDPAKDMLHNPKTDNLARQRRIYITPTLKIFKKPMYEESNTILRKYH